MGAPARASVAKAPPVKPRSPVSPVAAVAVKAAECHTVREILPPWHVLQEKLQNRNAAAVRAAAPEAEQAMPARELRFGT